MAFNNLDDNYSFLNDYLDKVIDQSNKIDPNVAMEDDNNFFNTKSDEPDPSEDIQYDVNQDDNNDSSQNDDAEEQQNFGDNNILDYLLGNNDPYDMDSDTEGASDVDTEGGEPTRRVGSKISANESQGSYSAFNSKGGGAGAVGKYQFRWNIWKDSIQKITGVKSEEQFRHSPKAQEKYFAWYEKNYLKPAADKLKDYNKMGLNEDQLEQLIHFRGEGGAKKYLLGKAKDKPESYNMPTSKYIAKHAMGGAVVGGGGSGVPVAMSSGSQHMGLNNGSFSEMIFPMHGENEFRGLDNYEPVYLEDETGKKKILKGKHHKAKMTGNVYEKKLK